MIPSPSAEQRRYFRIEDSISLYARPAQFSDTNDESIGALQQSKRLLDELSRIDREHQRAFKSLQERHKDVAECLLALNQKVDTLAHQLVLANSSPYFRCEKIILSGGGIGFPSDRNAEIGEAWAFDLLLSSTSHIISFAANIVWSRRSGTQYFLGAEITDISDADRDAIIKHTLLVQAHERRMAKEI